MNKPRALLSVSDKTHLIEFAKGLVELGFDLLATGGTAKALEAASIPLTDISSYTGQAEILDGRVKTLHPKIFAGILYRRGLKSHEETVEAESITPIDLIAVNLYPFVQTINQADCTVEKATENIDIGGPSLIRAAAKNHESVAVITDPNDYTQVLEEIKANQGKLGPKTKRQLAIKAYAHTADYDSHITAYLTEVSRSDGTSNHSDSSQKADFPEKLPNPFKRHTVLRYGENPHQQAALYETIPGMAGTIPAGKQHQGKPLSYNNIADADTALEAVSRFEQPACVIVKHANPCGVAVRETALDAYRDAFNSDPTSAFGGIIAFNQEVNVNTASYILGRQFAEVIVATEFDQEALELFQSKPNLRLLSVQKIQTPSTPWRRIQSVTGGLLVQDADIIPDNRDQWEVVSKRMPTEQEIKDMDFAWQVVKSVKSNAIVFARSHCTLGIGGGQTSRIDSTRIAIEKAESFGLSVKGAVIASDAFFPFPDNVEMAAKHGVTAIIQPGGSVKDQSVIDTANKANIAMLFTGKRHFRH